MHLHVTCCSYCNRTNFTVTTGFGEKPVAEYWVSSGFQVVFVF